MAKIFNNDDFPKVFRSSNAHTNRRREMFGPVSDSRTAQEVFETF